MNGIDVENIWLRPSDIAGLPGYPSHPWRVSTRAAKENWPSRPARGAKGGGGKEYPFSVLTEQAQAALLLKLSRGMPGAGEIQRKDDEPEGDQSESGRNKKNNRGTLNEGITGDPASRESLWNRFERAPGSLQGEARRMLGVLLAVEKLEQHGQPRTAALEAVAQANGESPATIRRWFARVRGVPACDRLPHLLKSYTGRTATAGCSPEAWDYFKADYLRPEKPGASACYRRLLSAAGEHGWDVPSLATLQRRVEKELPRAVTVLAREGEEALDRLFPAQERDHAVFGALEAVCADFHTFDVNVIFENGERGRPSLIAWQDIYSGKILSTRLGETPNAHLVRLSLGDLIEAYGIPERAWLDNGREFAAKLITGGTKNRYRFKVKAEDPRGILTELGVAIHWTTPYRGQAKPIERSFRDFCEDIARHPALAGCYTGNSPAAKPSNYGERAIPLSEFKKIAAQGVLAHNSREGRASPVCAGRSFDRAFEESYAARPIRKASAAQRRLCLLAAESVTARRPEGAVHLFGNRYWSEPLLDHAASKILVRFDPDDLHAQIHAYTLSGAFIASAPCMGKAGFADLEAAQEHSREKGRFKRATREVKRAQVRLSALEAAKFLPEREETPPPAANVVELVPQLASPEERRRIREENEEKFGAAMARLTGGKAS